MNSSRCPSRGQPSHARRPGGPACQRVAVGALLRARRSTSSSSARMGSLHVAVPSCRPVRTRHASRRLALGALDARAPAWSNPAKTCMQHASHTSSSLPRASWTWAALGPLGLTSLPAGGIGRCTCMAQCMPCTGCAISPKAQTGMGSNTNQPSEQVVVVSHHVRFPCGHTLFRHG